jgi:hypothetical protein
VHVRIQIRGTHFEKSATSSTRLAVVSGRGSVRRFSKFASGTGCPDLQRATCAEPKTMTLVALEFEESVDGANKRSRIAKNPINSVQGVCL